MMLLVRREFLQLTGTIVVTSAASQPTEGAAGRSPTEILRSDLVGQDHRVAETTVVFFPPGSAQPDHPGVREPAWIAGN